MDTLSSASNTNLVYCRYVIHYNGPRHETWLACHRICGSFSHSTARTIQPVGKLYTFEYHAERTAAAEKDFTDHGLTDIIQIQQRDEYKDGFGMNDAVHAVFLDLPAPWEAIASATAAFLQHRTGRICTFSPCIEQAAKSVQALNENGFVESSTKEAGAKRTLEETEVTEVKLQETITTMLVSRTPVDTRGHTSYMALATFLPAIENNVAPEGADDLMETVVVEAEAQS